MTMATYSQNTPRIGKFKGETLKHAVPREVLAKGGRQVKYDKNNSDTYVARRWLPYGATNANQNTMNQFFQNGTGDRAVAMAQAHLTQEGVTPTPDSITPVDFTVVMQQYSCLYGYTDKTADLYEDNVPEQMAIQTGERVALVNEQIIYGQLKSSTNQFYGGTGTTRATVNGAISLGLLRAIAKNLMANHATMVNKVLSASNNYGTDAVADGFTVYANTDLEPDIRDLPGFIPAEKYASGKPMPYEIGKCERFRFVMSPDLPSLQDAGATVAAAPGLISTTGTNIDVYQFIVTGQDAWSQIAVRGKDSLMATDLKPGEPSKSDPFGQRGYAGAMWWKAVLVENPGWMAVGNVGTKKLTY